MDGTLNEYHRKLSAKLNYKDHSHLEGIQKFYDRCKDEAVHAYSIEERELQKSLLQLKKEKSYHKRRGSVLGSNEHEDHDNNFEDHKDLCKNRKSKGLIVKLKPGKIDTDCMSPPNSHDVAVRMLYDKKSQTTKKKKKPQSKENINAHPQYQLSSKSHQEAVLRLPNIDKKGKRRKSHAESINHPRPDSKNSIEIIHDQHKPAKYHSYKYSSKPDIVVMTPEESERNAKEILRKQMITPTPDKWQQSPPVVPQRAWDPAIPLQAQHIKNYSFDEIDRVTECNMPKLPHIQIDSRTNLVDTNNNLPQGYVRDDRRGSIINATTSSNKQRRTSMNYNDMDYFERRNSFAPSDIQKRRTSFDYHGGRRQSVSNQDDPKRHGRKDSEEVITDEMLEHYYSVLVENQKLLLEQDSNFCIPDDEKKHIPVCTLKRSQRRKTLALEELLKQLPSSRHNALMDPKEMLDCRYLRLSKNNVEELEDLCRADGQDPGIHAHMTAEQVEDYFDKMDNESEESESLTDL